MQELTDIYPENMDKTGTVMEIQIAKIVTQNLISGMGNFKP